MSAMVESGKFIVLVFGNGFIGIEKSLNDGSGGSEFHGVVL